jgi:hypothetical protein
VFPAYHRMGWLCNYKPLGFDFCNGYSYRTFGIVYNADCVSLGFWNVCAKASEEHKTDDLSKLRFRHRIFLSSLFL